MKNKLIFGAIVVVAAIYIINSSQSATSPFNSLGKFGKPS